MTSSTVDTPLSARLSSTHKDSRGLEVTSHVTVPGSVTSYIMSFPVCGKEYDVTVRATSEDGESMVGRTVRTLPYVYCE